MTCQYIGGAIVCGPRRRERRCPCGQPATLLCDWRMPEKGGTCDAPLCARCTTSPAPDKDLCASHAAQFETWRQDRAGAR